MTDTNALAVLVRYHETGGLEGDCSDITLAMAKAELTALRATDEHPTANEVWEARLGDLRDKAENWQNRAERAEQALAERDAEIVRLRAALAPFAELADEAKESSSATQCDRDDFFVTQIGGYNIGDLLLDDFLAARAALGGTDVTE